MTSKIAKINFITSRAMDIVRTVYYVHGKLGDEINFCSDHYIAIIKRQFLYLYTA